MNSRHYKRKPKTKQFERKKVFKGINDSPSRIKWEFVEKEEEEPKSLSKLEKFKKWFYELPIWSIK